MTVQSPRLKKQLQQRLRRIEGQVRGVQRMLDEDRECHEIMQQLAAIRAAVHNASLVYMQAYATDCLANLDPADPESRQVVIDDLIGLMGKAT